MIIQKICLPLSFDMKQILYTASILVLLCGCKTNKAMYRSNPSAMYAQECSHHVLIITYDPAVGSKPLLEAARKMDGRIFRLPGMIENVAFRIPNNVSMKKAIRQLLSVKGVQCVEKDGAMHID